MSYPVFCGAIVLTSSNNRLRFREAAGAVGNVDLDAGTYYLNGDGGADDLCAALKAKLDAFGAGGNAYSVTVAHDVDSGTPHTRITITRTSGSSTFGLVVDGSTTFDMDLIGFTASTANDSAAKTSTQACAACWVSNDVVRESESTARKVAAVRQNAAGGVRGVSRSAKMRDWQVVVAFVAARRMKETEATATADALEAFIDRFGPGAAFEYHLADINAGTVLEALSTANTLVDTCHFSQRTVEEFDPPRLGPGVALYSLDMTFHSRVT